MIKAKVYEQKMNIPTYAVGKEEKNPMFFEKRVYQGSSGKVYPNAVIEKICDEKSDRLYNAVILENEWLYVIVLPQLGGRIYTAYDKTNNYDFVYHNKVIKPALVGLLGPWISGGIEFNWPQHHRPSTFMPTNFAIVNGEDGSASVFVGEIENMFGLKHTTEIKLYQDKSYIEINTQVFNGGDMTETFLWWANPAFKVNDDTKTIMPLDVTAVMDHGKRAVSTFPIATGEYYKMDYSAGVDISRYKNITVPTSFMAHKSNFDFVGGYDYGKNAGLLHVADHHVAPGKKQWTWGCGDFGIAWDNNLTDEDGPYIELMTGCFTDNQPDFTFIKPQEEKKFTQYFMPYHKVGDILNASKDICFGIDNKTLTVYSSAKTQARVVVKKDEKILIDKQFDLLPTAVAQLCDVDSFDTIEVIYDGKSLMFKQDMVQKFDIPLPATACPLPQDCKTCEELYLYGLHIEQYRHATRLAEDYYLEGLRRDNTDIRLNNAYGLLLLRRGQFESSIACFETAIDKMTAKNTNPISTEPYFNCGIANFYLGNLDKSYDLFYKCIWSNESKSNASCYLATIDYLRADFQLSYSHICDSVLYNGANVKARNLQALIAKKLGKSDTANGLFKQVKEYDKLNLLARYELGEMDIFGTMSHSEANNLSQTYLNIGEFEKAKTFLKCWTKQNGNHPLVCMYIAYAMIKIAEQNGVKDNNIDKEISCAIKSFEDGIVAFASSLQDIIVLSKVDLYSTNYLCNYYLGNLFYDKKQYQKASQFWINACELNEKFPTARRNLALYYYNKVGDKQKALTILEEAYALDTSDSRILMELFQLCALMQKPKSALSQLLASNIKAVEERDDLYLEYVRLVHLFGQNEEAKSKLLSRKFHPWEGGEGKVTKLYKEINCTLAQEAMQNGDCDKAIGLYKECLTFPKSFGEGKLILDFDNDIYYLMATCVEQFGRSNEAKEYYKLATRGNCTVADDMYYNDNPIEYIYCIALASKKLGDLEKANKIKSDFLRYYESHFEKKVVIDYFAVSLPDMLIWEQDLDQRNENFCKYILSLAEKI